MNGNPSTRSSFHSSLGKSRKGIILLSVIIILLSIAVIGASLVVMLSAVNFYTQTIANQTKAFYLAEAGIARTISMLRAQAGDKQEDIGPISLGEGNYTIKIDLIHSLITSTGNVGGSTKTVQLQYRAL